MTMLNLDHSQTKYVFKAAAIEDQIRAELECFLNLAERPEHNFGTWAI